MSRTSAVASVILLLAVIAITWLAAKGIWNSATISAMAVAILSLWFSAGFIARGEPYRLNPWEDGDLIVLAGPYSLCKELYYALIG